MFESLAYAVLVLCGIAILMSCIEIVRIEIDSKRRMKLLDEWFEAEMEWLESLQAMKGETYADGQEEVSGQLEEDRF